jgi:hypothetical protein
MNVKGRIEYSPSNHANCRICKKKIPEGKLRVCTIGQTSRSSKFVHLSCYVPKQMINSLAQFEGISQLQEEDKELVLQRLQHCNRWLPRNWRPQTEAEKWAMEEALLQTASISWLRAQLKKVGKSCSGRKQTLVVRLLQHLREHNPWNQQDAERLLEREKKERETVTFWALDPALDIFDVLPEEIILQIVSYLSLADLANVALLSKHFNILVQDDFLWKQLYLDAWPRASPVSAFTNSTTSLIRRVSVTSSTSTSASTVSISTTDMNDQSELIGQQQTEEEGPTWEKADDTADEVAEDPQPQAKRLKLGPSSSQQCHCCGGAASLTASTNPLPPPERLYLPCVTHIPQSDSQTHPPHAEPLTFTLTTVTTTTTTLTWEPPSSSSSSIISSDLPYLYQSLPFPVSSAPSTAIPPVPIISPLSVSIASPSTSTFTTPTSTTTSIRFHWNYVTSLPPLLSDILNPAEKSETIKDVGHDGDPSAAGQEESARLYHQRGQTAGAAPHEAVDMYNQKLPNADVHERLILKRKREYQPPKTWKERYRMEAARHSPKNFCWSASSIRCLMGITSGTFSIDHIERTLKRLSLAELKEICRLYRLPKNDSRKAILAYRIARAVTQSTIPNFDLITENYIRYFSVP